MLAKLRPEQLRELLDYDPATGLFLWKPRGTRKSWDTRYAGKPAFTAKSAGGYMLGRINGIPEYAHRVAYAIWFGEWPSQQIDHINGNRADNRIANLRQVDASGNQRNKLVSKVGASGNIGVYWHAATNKWLASIGLNGRQTHLGLFEQKSDAVDARRRAELENGFTLRVAQ